MTPSEDLINRFLDDALEGGETLELERVLRASPRDADQFLSFYQQDRLLTVLCRPSQASAIDAIMEAVLQEDRFVDATMQRAHVLDRQRPLLNPGGGTRAVEPEAQNRKPPMMVRLSSRFRDFFFRPRWALALATVLLLGVLLWLFPAVNNQPTLSLKPGRDVVLERNGGSIAAQNGMSLHPGDLLKASGTSEVSITYGPEPTSIALLGDTELKVLSWGKGKQLELGLGKIEVNAARQRPLKPMVLRTALAEARVVGTKFLLIAATNATRLEVTEGGVRFTRLGESTNILVHAGEYAVASAGYELSAQPLTGSILREYWTNLPGELWINILTSNPNYPNHPNGHDYLSKFEAPSDWGKDYGARICGYVHPPRTGDYTFWLSSSLGGGLWFSPDDDPRHARQVATARNSMPRTWTEEKFQQSPPIHLIAGRKYYIQALQKHGRGADHLAVAWQGPGRDREIIPGEFLSPFEPERKEKKR